MQTEYIRAGSVDVRISVDQIIDASTLASVTNTAGRGLTGLAFNTASLTCYYFREDNGNNVSDQLTLVTYTRGATHTDGGFVEQDATNSPGDYWLCLSDAMVAGGAGWCKITLKGAANMVQKSIKIILTQATTEITSLTTELAKVPKSDSTVSWNPTALASIKSEIWGALTSALTTAGTIGKLLVDNLNATVSSRSSHTAADTWAVGTRVLTAGTNIVLAKGTGITGFNDLSAAQVNTEADQALVDIHLDHLLAVTYDPAAKPGVADALLNELVESDGGVSRFTANSLEAGIAPSAAEIADAVWDEGIVGHLTAGSTGAALNAAGSAGDPWVTPLPGAYGAGTAGNIIGANLNATVGSRATNADQVLIKAKTDQLNFSKANEVDANAQSFNGVTITGFGSPGDKFGV